MHWNERIFEQRCDKSTYLLNKHCLYHWLWAQLSLRLDARTWPPRCSMLSVVFLFFTTFFNHCCFRKLESSPQDRWKDTLFHSSRVRYLLTGFYLLNCLISMILCYHPFLISTPLCRLRLLFNVLRLHSDCTWILPLRLLIGSAIIFHKRGSQTCLYISLKQWNSC